ncbi:alpha/beta fold hydrolase [Novosphingobium cyanobacteriorum]|uniref:Alpha/beta fold hydrolase n=1 Tax=Novosphingobium cyanobacteriorum TaxID=3024215 RepID=A0ABT6CNT0_9SPHN|nr:alpha/beta fold hydrolase [Novosphingobium cyanobacteriorum]MDF8335179.1 alpha/beta fold hydrolase [Novosphingobium cyanobacteriorum]
MKIIGALFGAMAFVAISAAAHAQEQPTVVLESGLGDGADVWNALRAKLALPNFAYDRPGYGGTPVSLTPRDPCTIAHELHERLAQAGVRPPYVLVGHSLGGRYAYAFARLYPQDTTGLVLVDATPPGHWDALQREMPAQATALKVIKSLTFSRAMRREFDGQEQCLAQLPTAPMSMPVRVLLRTIDNSGGGGAKLRDIDYKLAQHWLALTGAPRLERVDGSGHYIQKDKPDVLTEIIRQVCSQGR